MITIDPEKIKVFSNAKDKHFYLITNSEILSSFEIKENTNFISNTILLISNSVSFESLLSHEILNDACILIISPNVFFQSPTQDKLGNRRVIAMACNSTPTNIEDIHHFWECLVATNPIEQQKKTDAFFELGEKSNYLKFVDNVNDTSAVFNHLDDSYLWSEQTGVMHDGEQQLAPSGEISVLPIDIQEFNENLRLDFNGSIAFHGTPILHNGTPSFTRKDQERIYTKLSGLKQSAIIGDIENGVIVNIKATGEASKDAVAMLNNFFETDSRYRILWEIGFGINRHITIRNGNHAMNETYGGETGSVHFGVGLTPYTQYHLDIICPNMNVLTENNEVMIGRHNEKNILRKIKTEKNMGSNCACIENEVNDRH